MSCERVGKINTYLNVIISVVVDIDDPVELGIFGHMKFRVALNTLRQSLPGIFLHLDVEKFPGK